LSSYSCYLIIQECILTLVILFICRFSMLSVYLFVDESLYTTAAPTTTTTTTMLTTTKATTTIATTPATTTTTTENTTPNTTEFVTVTTQQKNKNNTLAAVLLITFSTILLCLAIFLGIKYGVANKSKLVLPNIYYPFNSKE